MNGFLKQVVVSRRDVGIRRWARWVREDLDPGRMLGSGLISYLLSLFLLFLFMLSSQGLDAFFFCRSGHPVVTPDQFLDFVGHLLPQEPLLDLPRITGRDLQEVAGAKKSTAGGLAAVTLVFWSGHSLGVV